MTRARVNRTRTRICQQKLLLPQQDVDGASSTISPRGISVGEHGPMLPEALSHARLEDREIPLGMQPPAVDDADAAMAVATIVDEPLQARDGFRGGLAMQVEPAAGGVFSALQSFRSSRRSTPGATKPDSETS
jgi:hypothetical protein